MLLPDGTASAAGPWLRRDAALDSAPGWGGGGGGGRDIAFMAVIRANRGHCFEGH